MEEKTRWGILGPGRIARSFAAGLRESAWAEIAAVGSRSLERAERFAAEFEVPLAYGDYGKLAEDDSLDAIYIATPHSFHHDHTILCLRAGRHVLCEKPLAVNAAEAEEMIGAARRERRTLMEAMWMRFIPSIVKVRGIVASGAIGEVRRITADFGFRAGFDPEDRLFDISLGGGALLDVGIYPLSLAHMLLGRPDSVEGIAHIGRTGVDEESAALLGYEDGRQAVLTMAIRLDSPMEAYILGTEGSIRIPKPWWRSERIVVTRHGHGEETVDCPLRGNGYVHEIDEFCGLVRDGKAESEVMPLAESLSVMETMDRIRESFGLKYRGE